MTAEDIQLTDLGIIDNALNRLIIKAGIEWVEQNTTLVLDELTHLPFTVKLFLIKFFDLQNATAGVSSESIEGMSQSFDSTDKSALLWQYAYQLLGAYLKTPVKYVNAQSRWSDGY